MRTRWFMLGAIALVGLVWIAQGLGWLPGSGFMSNEPIWAVIGAAMIASVIGILVWTFIRRTRA